MDDATDPAAPVREQISTPSECAADSYVSHVSWMGIANEAGGWRVVYSAADDAAACCSICFGGQAGGCDGWTYMASGGASPGTDCSMIVGWQGAGGGDAACPAGHTGVTFNTAEANNASHVGGAGPCATVVR